MNNLMVKNLTKYYGNLCAVDHVSFSLERGSITALCGKNGSGKSTSMKCMLNILKEDGGEITADGKEWQRDPLEIGYLPEERGLFQKITVYEQLKFFGGLKIADRAKLDAAIQDNLALFGIEKYKNALLGTLSKGNQQKVQMIAAILHSPQLLILDEPFSGLDPVNLNLFIEVLRGLKKKDMCILLSSHQLGIVEDFCENICILDGGKTLFSGSVIDLEQKHGGDYLYFTTKDRVPLSYGASEYAPCKYRIPIKGKEDFRNAFLELLDSGLALDEIGRRKMSLQEIFISLTEGRGAETCAD